MTEDQCLAIVAAILVAGRLAWASGQARPQPERLISEEMGDAVDLLNEAKKALEKGK
jgi:hypothetical protein